MTTIRDGVAFQATSISLNNVKRPSYLAIMITFTSHLLLDVFQRLLDTVPIAKLVILYLMHK
jgi:hypothetical protein